MGSKQSKMKLAPVPPEPRRDAVTSTSATHTLLFGYHDDDGKGEGHEATWSWSALSTRCHDQPYHYGRTATDHARHTVIERAPPPWPPSPPRQPLSMASTATAFDHGDPYDLFAPLPPISSYHYGRTAADRVRQYDNASLRCTANGISAEDRDRVSAGRHINTGMLPPFFHSSQLVHK